MSLSTNLFTWQQFVHHHTTHPISAEETILEVQHETDPPLPAQIFRILGIKNFKSDPDSAPDLILNVCQELPSRFEMGRRFASGFDYTTYLKIRQIRLLNQREYVAKYSEGYLEDLLIFMCKAVARVVLDYLFDLPTNANSPSLPAPSKKRKLDDSNS